jgi:tetratricopeptide (TPR) repeat protein
LPLLRSKYNLLLALALVAVCAAYANHFHNGFHFDDAHTVIDNPSIRSLSNLPRFFTDASTFSVLPANRTYRPMVSASLALDYALGRGYHPFWFHLCTFLFFLAQLVAMYALFTTILDAARPPSSDANRLAALLAVAWYGLHPAMAETVNYIIQRGDLFCAFGVVAALAVFARFPAYRKTGLYLLPFVFALLSKPPAAVFPLLLFLYLIFFESEGQVRWLKTALATLPSALVCALLMVLQAAMTPKTFAPSMLSAYSYRITQPFVLMRYFAALFLPLHLNVDTDLQPFASLTPVALCGFFFVAALLAAAWIASRRQTLKPIAFGVLWFLIASLPTSLYRLSEVENDHRMFLPFVGLVLAVVWTATLLVEKAAAGKRSTARAALAAAILLLLAFGYGVHQRNRVWSSDEALWLDDVQKCPHNGRGWMNYGLTLMARGVYPAALRSFQNALLYTPNYPSLEINLGIVNGAMNNSAEAERHFLRAIALAPASDEAHFFYGRWLYFAGRVGDALAQLRTAVQLNPARLTSRDLLASADAAIGDMESARAAAADALRIDPSDAAAKAILAQPAAQNHDYWINASLYRYQSGDYAGCIAAAQQALKINPNSALAYNNIGAAYAGMKQWSQAIDSERQALRLQPEFTLAKNNLALYAQLKAGKESPPAAAMPPEEWLNASLRANQAGRYQESIQDARAALRLRPNYAEAYNNIAAGYESLGQWDEAIAAAKEAIRINPGYQLAKNNLAWSLEQKSKSAR